MIATHERCYDDRFRPMDQTDFVIWDGQNSAAKFGIAPPAERPEQTGLRKRDCVNQAEYQKGAFWLDNTEAEGVLSRVKRFSFTL